MKNRCARPYRLRKNRGQPYEAVSDRLSTRLNQPPKPNRRRLTRQPMSSESKACHPQHRFPSRFAPTPNLNGCSHRCRKNSLRTFGHSRRIGKIRGSSRIGGNGFTCSECGVGKKIVEPFFRHSCLRRFGRSRMGPCLFRNRLHRTFRRSSSRLR